MTTNIVAPLLDLENDEMKSEAAGAADEFELTILMPCLNEAKTIATCIAKARGFLARSGIRGEVLIADNGSTDGSIEIAQTAGARVVRVASRGYGAALAGGIAAAKGRYLIMGDADDSYDFANLDPFVAQLRAGFDLVMGNRFKGGIKSGAMPFLHRYLGNPVLSFLGRLFFGIPVSDFHCGLRGFDKSRISALGLTTTGMEFASEMVVKSSLQRLRITEAPTTLKPDGRGRPPHLKTWRDGWRHLKFLLTYSPKWLFFYPGLLLISLGLLLTTTLMFGPLEICCSLRLDLNSFLAACLLSVMGAQIIIFGAVARYYATVSGILPAGPRSSRIVAWCKTDSLARVALILIIAGGGLFFCSVREWAKVDFGDLVSPIVPRLVASGLSLIVIGIQTAFGAFLFGIFDIPVRKSQ